MRLISGALIASLSVVLSIIRELSLLWPRHPEEAHHIVESTM
jgi:hypothetical protein